MCYTDRKDAWSVAVVREDAAEQSFLRYARESIAWQKWRENGNETKAPHGN